MQKLVVNNCSKLHELICVLSLIFLGSPTFLPFQLVLFQTFPPNSNLSFLQCLSTSFSTTSTLPSLQSRISLSAVYKSISRQCSWSVMVLQLRIYSMSLIFFFYMPLVLTSVRRPTRWHGEDSNGGTVSSHITIWFLATNSLYIFTNHIYHQ